MHGSRTGRGRWISSAYSLTGVLAGLLARGWGSHCAQLTTWRTGCRRNTACCRLGHSCLLAFSPAQSWCRVPCPNLQVQVTDQPLTSFKMMENGRVGAAGSADGATTILQFSDSLVDIQPNEKQAITSVSSLEAAGQSTAQQWQASAPDGSCPDLSARLLLAPLQQMQAAWWASSSVHHLRKLCCMLTVQQEFCWLAVACCLPSVQAAR